MSLTLQELLKPVMPATLRRLFGDLINRSPKISAIARDVKEARLTYLSDQKIVQIEGAIEKIARLRVPGSFLECGIALGGSAIVIASLMPKQRKFHGYDVFGMIPPPMSEKDDEKSKVRFEVIKSGKSCGIGGDPYYGYIDNLYGRVKDNFSRFGLTVDGYCISLHKGHFEDTLHPPQEVAFAHIDCDWYDPVKLCLERIYPRLSPGGYIVLDDYNDYGGCRQATNEFLEGKTDIEVIANRPSFVFRKQS